LKGCLGDIAVGEARQSVAADDTAQHRAAIGVAVDVHLTLTSGAT